MYSKEVVKANLRRIQATLPFRLKPRTIEEARARVAHFDSLLDEDGILTRDLKPDEIEYIQGERILCKYDFRYFCSRYVKIKSQLVSKDEQVVLLRFNIGQRMTLDVYAEMEEGGFTIVLIQLKARQLGISTITEFVILHRALFYSNINALIASSTPNKSRKMADMMLLALENMPYWLKPEDLQIWESGEDLMWSQSLRSGVSVQHGNKTTGIARGETPNVFHLCFAPQTLVQLSDGTTRPITEIKAGDRVVTSLGSVAPVKAVTKSFRRNEVTTDLHLWGNFQPLSTTRDHRILTDRGYREAREIVNHDYVAMSVRPISQARKAFTVESYPAGNYSRACHAGRTKLHEYQFNFDFGWLLGLYLAEGTLQKDKRIGGRVSSLIFSVHEKEVDDFAARLQRAVGSEISVTTRMRRRQDTKTRVISISFSALARWIGEHFGSVDTKRIPEWVWECGRDFCKGLVAGYLEGDGHISPSRNDICATSIRLAIPLQIRSLIASLGYGWSALYYKPAGNYYNRECREAWVLYVMGSAARELRAEMRWPTFAAADALHWKYSPDKRQVYIEVQRNADGYSEDFYDLEVDAPEHDFCTIQCCVKNSEVSEFENAEDLIDASLMRAFHADRRNFGVLESTAEGMGNWWETTWLASTEGLTRFTPLFLPWFVGTDLYPTRDWLVERPIPENYTPIPEALKHAARAADYTRTQPLLRRYLGDDWQMPTEQIWFWEFNYKDAKRRKLLNKFYQEMPAEPMEAFQASNMMVFEPDEIADFARNRKPLYGCYGVVGTGIPERLWPHKREIDPSREILTVRADWMQGGAVMSFQFVPLRYEGFPSCPWENRVFIWELPNDSSEYTVGVDTSYGMGQDRSVIEVLRKGSVFQASEQVLEYANAYVNSMDLAPITIAIATLYSRPRASQPEQCKVAIEVMGNGETTQLEMIKIGWSNFHRWERYDKIRQQQSHPSEKKGWYTNSWSRPMLIDRVNRAIRDGALQLNSPWLIEELKTLSKDEFQQAIKAEYGKFDDRYMAGAIAYFSGDVWDHMFGGDEAGASSKQERERKMREREAWESQTTPNFDFGLPTLDGDFGVTDYGLPVRKTWEP